MPNTMTPTRAARLRRIARDTAEAMGRLDRLRQDLRAELTARYDGQEGGAAKASDAFDLIRIAFDRVEPILAAHQAAAVRALDDAGEPLSFERTKAAPAPTPEGPTLMEMYGGGWATTEAPDAPAPQQTPEPEGLEYPPLSCRPFGVEGLDYG